MTMNIKTISATGSVTRLPEAPEELFVRGDAKLVADVLASQSALSITGARAATAYGEAIARQFAGDLTLAKIAIVTGGGYGIDAAALRGALNMSARPIVVAAGGPDRTYPAGHVQLFDRVVEAGGAIISWCGPGTPPTKERFTMRNQLLAACTPALLVVEAGIRSGTQSTANHALALGNSIGAVPGPITSAASAGTNHLLRQGFATAVTTADEALQLVVSSR